MPFTQEARCAQCDYQSAELFTWLNEVVSDCQNCQEVVAAEQGIFCDLNPYRCPHCSCELVDNHDPPCPRCQGKLDWSYGHVSDICMNPWTPGMTLHYLRLGRQRSGRAYGKVRGCLVHLEGPLARQPGLWFGEGTLTEEGRVWTTRRLRDAKVRPKELTVNTCDGQPWLFVDASQLLMGLESKVLDYQKAFHAWLDLDQGLATLCHLLLTEPAEVHCLDRIHDGTQWHAWADGLRICLGYSQQDVCWIAAGQPPPGPGTISNTERTLPWWVELWKGEVILRRWRLAELRQLTVELLP